MERMLHVLLVEDDETHAALVGRVLKKLQVSVDRVANAAEAMAYLQSDAPHTGNHHPDLILLDIGLPGMSGQGLLRRLKSDPAWAHLVVVVLTTSADLHDINQAYRSYANSYLIKPLDFRELEEMMESLTSYWSRWNQYPR